MTSHSGPNTNFRILSESREIPRHSRKAKKEAENGLWPLDFKHKPFLRQTKLCSPLLFDMSKGSLSNKQQMVVTSVCDVCALQHEYVLINPLMNNRQQPSSLSTPNINKSYMNTAASRSINTTPDTHHLKVTYLLSCCWCRPVAVGSSGKKWQGVICSVASIQIYSIWHYSEKSTLHHHEHSSSGMNTKDWLLDGCCDLLNRTTNQYTHTFSSISVLWPPGVLNYSRGCHEGNRHSDARQGPCIENPHT